jgi:Ion channel
MLPLFENKDARQRAFRAWQNRTRDPALTLLWGVEICLVFVAAPLAARGLPIARTVVETLLLAAIVLVALLSYRPAALILIVLGISATLASHQLAPESSPAAVSSLRHGGAILSLSSLTWVVLHAVFAPGRITFRRLQGAVVVYLNFAMIFASAFSLIWELSPGAFTLPSPTGGPGELHTMLYFSLTTLTTTGYGDIAPIDPFARSLANLESMIGVFYLAITVGRLVTLELAGRRG